MNFQEKFVEGSAAVRARAAALASQALAQARVRADFDRRAQVLKGSISVLGDATRKLDKVARRHASRFVKQNSALASAVGKDVSALARSTYASLSHPVGTKRKARTTARRRTAKAV